jgi:uncharacterized membrane protein
MKQFKQYMALSVVFAIFVAGVLFLIVDCTTVKDAWLTIGASLVCFAVGLALARMFNRRNMLPA